MSEPLIGVTCDVHLPVKDPDAYEITVDHRYTRALKAAGGYPVVLPIANRQALVPSYLERLDGVLFIGGDDVDPRLYKESPKPGTGEIFPARQRFERWVYEEARSRRLPVFGVCYGMQLINVLEGGSLHQDIRRDARSKLNHRNKRSPSHPVRIEPNSRLAYVLGRRTAKVSSEHHQAVNRLAPGFRAVAHAPDGIIEAIECDDECILAVQWHPERTLRSAATRSLFRWFVDLCCRHRPSDR